MLFRAILLMIVFACHLIPPAGATPRVIAPDSPPIETNANQPSLNDLNPPDAEAAPDSKDVYFDDITYTLRPLAFYGITVSPHDAETAYVTSRDGFIWRTTDGGKTWQESQLIVRPMPFYADGGQQLYFGSHRKSAGAWGLRHNNSDPDGVSFDHFDPQQLDLSIATYDPVRVGGARRGGATANSEIGVGLPGDAPRLQLLVRKLGKPTSGINIKQLLLARGTRPAAIKTIVVHPKDPTLVFACTQFGLYRSYDGGLTWRRTFIGETPNSRNVTHLAFDPKDHTRVLLGTGNGLYFSTDGGESFLRTPQYGVGDLWINHIYFHPMRPDYVFVGTYYGLVRSKNGGRSWDWSFFSTLPAARIVKYIDIDPHHPDAAYIATDDGIFQTNELLTGGVDTWQRVAATLLSGYEIHRIRYCPKHPGHLWAISNLKIPSTTTAGLSETGGSFLWETSDSGASWQVLYSGVTLGYLEWFDHDRHDPDLLWIAWSRSLSRMRRDQGPSQSVVSNKQFQTQPEHRSQTPTLSEQFDATRRYMGVSTHEWLTYLQRSRYKAFVPRLDVSYTHFLAHGYPELKSGLFAALPYLSRTSLSGTVNDFRAMLTWDLSDYVFNIQNLLFGRINRVNKDISSQIKIAVHRLYGEFRRLEALMQNNPPKDLRVRLIYRLRMEEIASYMDYISGGFLTRYTTAKQKPRAEDVLWF